jgi:thioredoxin 1
MWILRAATGLIRGTAMKSKAANYFLNVFFLAMSGATFAAEVPFNQVEFDRAVAQGEPTIVYLHATWCPTCKIQAPIVLRLSKETHFEPVTIFVADYDKETALKKTLKVTEQSTFVVFKQGHEATRSTGETKEAAIRKVFDQAL